MNKTLKCDECGASIEEYEEFYTWSEGHGELILCPCCFDAAFNELTLAEKARLVGSEVRSLHRPVIYPS